MVRAAAIVMIASVGLVVWAGPGTSSTSAERGPSVAAKNRPPYFPGTRKWTDSTKFEYDDDGELIGAVTTIKVVTKPKDPDHDRLTYTWKATNGKIRGAGLTAVWTRVCCETGDPDPGTVTLIVRDGHGGKATWKFVYD